MEEAEHVIDSFFSEIIDLSDQIYKISETGSSEFKSSEIMNRFLSRHGFTVEQPFCGMKTAFMARKGSGKMKIGFLAEYDALPNGHSCGHNLIAAWAAGSSVLLSRISEDFTVTVFGTPSEEGIGEYAGSKILMAEKRCFNGMDFMFGFHPDDRWSVGSVSLADITLEITFTGKESHGADSPESGINALDAAISAYTAINSLRGWAKNNRNLVVGMIFTEAGKATNVIPGRAVLQVEIRSTDQEFAERFSEKVKSAAEGSAESYGASVSIRHAAPVYGVYISNTILDSILQKSLESYNVSAHNIDEEQPTASGSTDEANVSRAVPVGHLDMQIGYPGISGHSEEFRIASDPLKNRDALRVAILSTVKAALSAKDRIMDISSEFNEKVKA